MRAAERADRSGRLRHSCGSDRTGRRNRYELSELGIAGRERDAIWDGPGSTGSVVVACPERLVRRYFPGGSIYKRKYQRTATGGHLPRLSRDWAQAGAGVADFLAPVNAAGCGCARVPDYADQRYWSRGAAVGGVWARRRTEPGHRLEE